ncbi:hypothetical protein AArc1_0603 [Natrarchaeobaculum sulfurireducens]|uniref:Uncharacterized protein n=2 Tax=Natrarchaeobaculum sulfurireducens TaxID=2044521 RepID=A0A346PBQ2_9EURY|nr:hypothetical protein AArc1_0603 [Natrarchaeobaculum sulfurireducens]
MMTALREYGLTVLFGPILPPSTGRTLLLVGAIVVSSVLLTARMRPADGGVRLALFCGGTSLLLVGASTLPTDRRWLVAGLRFTALLALSAMLFVLAGLLVFLWGMQQPK